MLAATGEFRGYLQEAMSPYDLRQETQDLQFREPGREERDDVFAVGLGFKVPWAPDGHL
jgi:hypothetical protein